MRLDKYFSSQKILSRSECGEYLKKGRIAVNGEIVKKGDLKIDPEKDEITLDKKPIKYEKYVYILLNKPFGVVSATEDGWDKTVIDLLPDSLQKRNLFPCGETVSAEYGLTTLPSANGGI